MKIAPHYTDKQWQAAFDGQENWKTAIDIVADRIRGRWLDAADRLLPDRSSGFAILALDCIILESLWGFMNGVPIPQGQERQAYRDILTGSRFGWKAGLADDFRLFVRHGLMHDAETRRGWLVEMTVPPSVVPRKNKNGEYQLNRTKFHKALEATFEDWITKLRAGDDADRRKNMRDRMNQIIAKHSAV